MGLKTTNYTIEKNGVFLPEAYAVIRNIDIYGTKGIAQFAIQASRENAINLEPLDTISIEFEFNRNENPYTTAYSLAKSVVYVKKGLHTIEHEMPFHGWEDDIVETE